MQEFVEALKYLLLGLIQGVTEVLPISSSGHVELSKFLLEMDFAENLMFLILVNTGSLLAFLVIYFKDLLRLVKDFFIYLKHPETREMTSPNFHFLLKLGVASIPAALVGVLFSDFIDQMLATYSILLSGVGLLLTATILYLIGYRRYRHGLSSISYKESFLIGLAQAVALVPGVSRSGMTTAVALKKGINIETALKFSFMMYIPISIGSIFLYLIKAALMEDSTSTLLPGSEYVMYYLLAFVGAFIATFFAFKVIFNIFRTNKLKYFSYYCFVIGLLSILLFIMQ
jgi:undecaprenyl-diphosphatase